MMIIYCDKIVTTCEVDAFGKVCYTLHKDKPNVRYVSVLNKMMVIYCDKIVTTCEVDIFGKVCYTLHKDKPNARYVNVLK